jgi:Domain of unknown function (DUF5671)
MENHTAKHFVLQLGSLVSLYLSISFLLVLLFNLITLSYPDPAEGYYIVESASSGIRLGIAMVVVFFPTYLILTRIVNKSRRDANAGTYLGLTKWLIYLSLLIGGIVILGDLVAVIMGFLEGELTQRFILKALSVLVVVGAAFHYYLLDAKGYWMKQEQKSILYAIGMGVVVFASVAYGFANIETPAAVREGRLDSQQVTDLQTIQYQIENYLALNGTLPEKLTDLDMSDSLPQAAEEREPYTYERTQNGFELCATFVKASTQEEMAWASGFDETMAIKNRDNWTHGEGRYCFERVLNANPQNIEPSKNFKSPIM